MAMHRFLRRDALVATGMAGSRLAPKRNFGHHWLICEPDSGTLDRLGGPPITSPSPELRTVHYSFRLAASISDGALQLGQDPMLAADKTAR